MKEIHSLIDYLKIICNRPFIADTSDYPDNRYLADMNEVVKEFIAKSDFLSDKEPKMDFPNEELTAFISQYRYILKDKFPQQSNGKYRYSILERYYHAIKRHNGAFEREIVPFDMLKPQFVQPNKDNPRILKQDGAFIVSGLDKNDIESDMKIRKYLANEVIIPHSAKKRILDDLEYVGINQATLFPEVDKVADYLRQKP